MTMKKQPSFVLPISGETINHLVRLSRLYDESEAQLQFSEWIANAPFEQLCAIALIQKLPLIIKADATSVAHQVERQLRNSLEGTRNNLVVREKLRTEFEHFLSLREIRKGAFLIQSTNIDVLRRQDLSPQRDDLRARALVFPELFSPSGNWNYEFSREVIANRTPFRQSLELSISKRIFLTSDQNRFLCRFVADMDESYDVTGLFGGGKTFIARQILSFLKSRREFRPVLMAQSIPQLNALKKQPEARGVPAITFAHAARQAYNTLKKPPHWEPGNRAAPNYNLSHETVARKLNFHSIGTLSPSEVAEIAEATMKRFCASPKPHVTDKMLPFVPGNPRPDQRTLLADCAEILFWQTMEPDDEQLMLPMRGYHIIKYSALKELSLPLYTHIVIDESHDLTSAMMQFLDKCPQALISMGDPHQRLTGIAPRYQASVHRAELTTTVRSSEQVEDTFNTLISRHPASTGVFVRGQSQHRTRLRHYEGQRIPPLKDKTTILVNDWSEMMEWLAHVKDAQMSYALLPGSQKGFLAYLSQLTSLKFNDKNQHRVARGQFKSWEDFEAFHASDRHFQEVDRLLSTKNRNLACLYA
ncbi:hypothetical protein ACMC9M_08475 [Pseudomonadota bacterium 24LQ007]